MAEKLSEITKYTEVNVDQPDKVPPFLESLDEDDLAEALGRIRKHAALVGTCVKMWEPVKWIVPEILPAGCLLLLCGPSKIGGKSILTIEMAKAISTGRPFIGQHSTQKAVMYVNLEDGMPRIGRRYKQAGVEDDAENPIWVVSDVESYNDLLIAMYSSKAKFIVLDPLAELENLYGVKDEKNSGEMTAFIKPIRDFVHYSGATVMIVHHFRKSGDMYRGSTALAAAVDGWWDYTPGKKPEYHRIESTLRDAGFIELGVHVRFDDNKTTLEEMPIEEVGWQPKKEKRDGKTYQRGNGSKYEDSEYYDMGPSARNSIQTADDIYNRVCQYMLANAIDEPE
jgi:hypothetical protein